MTKEEILKSCDKYEIFSKTYFELAISAMQEYADQQTSELKAELVKATETAKVTSVTQRQHIERLQNELAKNDKEIERLKIKNMLLVQKNCVLKDINDDIQSELNELKERHKKDIIEAYNEGWDSAHKQGNKYAPLQYYKQKFESND